MGSFEQSVSELLERELRSMQWPSWLEGGRLLKHMEYKTTEMFLYDKLQSYVTDEEMAAIYNGYNSANGADALKLYLFDSVRSRITDRLERGEDAVQSFNDETADWPHTLRAEFAAYEYQEGREGDYSELLHDFAQSEGVLDVTFEQTELSHYYDDNPYDDGDLLDGEARAVMVARMNDFDGSSISFDEVVNIGDFIWWLKEAETIGGAIRGHKFGRDIPVPIVEAAAPPGEWDELNPDNIHAENCTGCDEAFYEVRHNDTGHIEYINDDAEIESPTHVDDSSTDIYSLMNSGVVFCEECLENIMRGEDSRKLLIDSHGNSMLYTVSGQYIMYQDGTRPPELGDRARDILTDFTSGLPPSEAGMVELRPQERPESNPSEQASLINDVINNGRDGVIESGPVIFERNENGLTHNYRVFFDRNDFELARHVKELLESGEVVA